MNRTFPRVVVGTKPCRDCGATINFYNDVSFQHSLRKGGTLCRKCTGGIRRNKPLQARVLSINPPIDRCE